jgi:hypothetical protein
MAPLPHRVAYGGARLQNNGRETALKQMCSGGESNRASADNGDRL